MVGRHTPHPTTPHARTDKPAARLKQAVYFDCPGFGDCFLNSYYVLLPSRYVIACPAQQPDTNLATVIVITDRPSPPSPRVTGSSGGVKAGLPASQQQARASRAKTTTTAPVLGSRRRIYLRTAYDVVVKQRHERGTGTRARPVQTRCPRVPDAGVVFWDGFQSCFAVSKDESARTVWDLTRRGDCDAGSIANVYWLWQSSPVPPSNEKPLLGVG